MNPPPEWHAPEWIDDFGPLNLQQWSRLMNKPVNRSVKWHENNVLRLAKKFSDTFVTTAGYGGPVARAAGVLNDAVEKWQATLKHSQTQPKVHP